MLLTDKQNKKQTNKQTNTGKNITLMLVKYHCKYLEYKMCIGKNGMKILHNLCGNHCTRGCNFELSFGRYCKEGVNQKM